MKRRPSLSRCAVLALVLALSASSVIVSCFAAPRRVGDAEKGGRMFFDLAGKAGCARCHTVRGRGGKVGPELTHVASNRGVAYMVEAILAPSYVIVPGFEPYVILAGDDEYVGIKKAEDDRSVTFMLIDGNMETIQKSEIRSIARRETSVMPDNFSKVLTVEEFHDILSFLRTLR